MITKPTASNLEILILGSIQIYSLNDDVLSSGKYTISIYFIYCIYDLMIINFN